jgi:hypothetical protein
MSALKHSCLLFGVFLPLLLGLPAAGGRTGRHDVCAPARSAS